MARTPKVQPVAADSGWVNVFYMTPWIGNTLQWQVCAVRRLSSFRQNVEEIMREGIWLDDDSAYIPASAIIYIADRPQK